MVKYIVQRGDTLGTIAAKYDTTVEAIAKANGIRNPNVIHKGQILRVPSPHYDPVVKQKHQSMSHYWNKE
ncbi:LysM peptidoglycan-binding domain-containing protein [Alicyclobacillus fastidiosus]|uniref:LysM domain-containing protein n=1 Tax=Alicyclobacillus fastidiosus TaxID=392011 RepID=A0ABV5AK12_9BACL|nr:LysM domain-containing protein [Alicyclobacillus fastidiosus]WEH11034.1 LysM domain-containing protein [Alicyclobacillus fastidiosus]